MAEGGGGPWTILSHPKVFSRVYRESESGEVSRKSHFIRSLGRTRRMRCVFSGNLPLTLLAERPGSFTCYCGNTSGVGTETDIEMRVCKS